MEFRRRLIATLRAVQPVLAEPGVLVIGSEVPNLLQSGVASTLVVSQDVDLGVSVSAHARVKTRLGDIRGLRPSSDEPSIWVPEQPELIEVNFVGMDPTLRDATTSYVLDDDLLPLIVFGGLSFLRPGPSVDADGLRIPVPRPAGLLLEKLLTDRSGEKGDRDLLVALALLLVARGDDLVELAGAYADLAGALQHAVLSNLTLLSLLGPVTGMPDPTVHRDRVAALIARLERAGRAP